MGFIKSEVFPRPIERGLNGISTVLESVFGGAVAIRNVKEDLVKHDRLEEFEQGLKGRMEALTGQAAGSDQPAEVPVISSLISA